MGHYTDPKWNSRIEPCEGCGKRVPVFEGSKPMCVACAESKPATAATPQPMPKMGKHDVGRASAELLRFIGKERLACDVEARISMGEKKYGTRLKTDNGRNAAMDAYQEALDGINYAMQLYLEADNNESAEMRRIMMYFVCAAELLVPLVDAR